MEEIEGEDGDGGGGWHNTSVFVMISSQNISFCNKIGRAHALTLFTYLISNRAHALT